MCPVPESPDDPVPQKELSLSRENFINQSVERNSDPVLYVMSDLPAQTAFLLQCTYEERC
jgi:hypothetical protein